MAINLSSFLSDGAQIPAGSALKASQTETVLPQFYTDYAQQILANQQALASQPYQTYQGPRVAEFSPAQQQGFAMTGQAAGAYQPALTAATTATSNLMGQTALSGAQPYFTAATQLNPIQAAAPDYNAARGLATQAGAANPLAAAQPYLSAAGTMSGVQAAQPFLQQGQQFTQASTNPMGMQGAQPYFGAAGQLSGVSAAVPALGQSLETTQAGTQAIGMQAAQPYLEQAGGTSADVSAYMDPYVQNVVKQVAELGERNLRESLLPALTSKYISAGQLGFGPRGGAVAPSGLMTDTARALRDVQEATLSQQGQLLSKGFEQARQAAQTDLARKAQLASTAGQLGTQQQQALLEAARQQEAVGTQLGNLTQAQQNALINLGTQAGALGTEQQRAMAQAGQQLGAFGQIAGNLTAQQQQNLADIGSRLGTLTASGQTGQLNAAQQLAALGTSGAELTAAQQKLLADLGIQAANIGGADITRRLASAEQLAGLGGLAQKYGLEAAGAVTGVGKTQQEQAQQNLNVAYENFLKQQGYNQEQIDKMLATFKGVAPGVPTVTQEYGIVPAGQQTQPPSTASTIGGTLLGLASLLKG